MKKKVTNSTYHWSDENVHTPSISKDLANILSKKNFQNLEHLDIGCGNGFITKIINKFFKKTTGIDLSSEGIKLAKKKSKKIKDLNFLNIHPKKLIKKKIKYDVITAIEVIEHQYDPFKFMSDIEKLSKKKGYVLITTPYHGYIKNLVLSILGLMDSHFTALWTHGHIKFFSIKSLKKLISNYQFDIEEISFSGRFYPLSSSMIFLLRRK
jgi:2-polyprenyl-6-hydroxyphenyl methylase/3-demethylubiquinone-9 3-methyltransferase